MLGELYSIYHLVLNPLKTKTMIWSYSVDFETYPRPIMNYDKMAIENCKLLNF